MPRRPGPPPTPDNVLEMRGRPGKRPPRPEVKPEPIAPKPPPRLAKGARAIWRYHAPELEKHGLLTRLDREAFAFACSSAALGMAALEAMLDDKKNFTVVETDPGHNDRLRRHPAFIVYTQAVADYRRWCAEFGLTPSSRVGLGGAGLPEIPDEEEDADLFDGTG